MLNRIFKAALFFSATFIFYCPNLYAKEKLVFGTWEWTPITSSKLEGYGLASEIITKAYEAEGIEIEIQFYPWKRCELMLRNNQLDAIFPYVKTDEREKIYGFSDPVVVIRLSFFYLKDNIAKLEYNSLEDLKKYSFGGVLGHFYKEEFDKAGLNVEYVGSEEHNLKRLLKGRVDVIPMINTIGWYLINKNHPEDYYRFASVDYNWHIISGKKSAEEYASKLMVSQATPKANKIIQAYNRGLKKIKQNGEYKKILAKYGVKHIETDMFLDSIIKPE